MKRGNALVKSTKFKVFIYTNKDFEFNWDNVFISGVYRTVGHFLKDNPGMRPLISYEAEHIVGVLSKQLKAAQKKARARK